MLDALAGGPLLAFAPGATEHQAHRDTGDGGVYTAVVHQAPDDQGQRNVHVPSAHARPQQQPEEGEADERAAERGEVQIAGEEDGDDQDREEIVDDREGEQEGAQRGGQRGPDDREDGERERDIGGGGDGPAAQRPAAQAVDQHIYECGRDHSGQRRYDGKRGGPGIAQLTGHQLALDLDAGDEEEDREETVGRPVLYGEVEAERGRSGVEGAHGGVAVAQRGVRPDQGGEGGDEQEHSTDGLGTQGVREIVPLGQRETTEKRTRGGGGRGHGEDLRGGEADMTYRMPTRLPGAPRISCCVVDLLDAVAVPAAVDAALTLPGVRGGCIGCLSL